MQIRTRASYSSVHYNYNISGPGTLSCETTHGAKEKDMKIKRYTRKKGKEEHSGDRTLDLILSGNASYFLATRFLA